MLGGLLAALLLRVAAAHSCPPEQCGQAPASGWCPTSSGAASDPVLAVAPSNIYFSNAAPHAVSVNYVHQDGTETSSLRMAPGTRLKAGSVAGDVWRARLIRPGHYSDGQVMLEHRVGIVSVFDCECPQPEFVDCAKPHFHGPRWTSNDPVTFDNRAGAPLDLFYWCGQARPAPRSRHSRTPVESGLLRACWLRVKCLLCQGRAPGCAGARHASRSAGVGMGALIL
jgi:hypothetical protein